MPSSHSSSQGKLDHVRQLLAAGQPDKALQFIEKAGSQSAELTNALGVCLMRVGHTERAVNVLRDLVFRNHMCIPGDTPPLFQANFATVLLLKKNNQGAIEIINGLPASAHPYIGRLRQAIDQWRKKLPIHQRLRCLITLYPGTPVEMPFPPGEV